MPTPEQVRNAIQVYIDGFNIGKSNREVWLAGFAENAEQIDPIGTPARVGKAGIGGWYDGAFQLCDRIELQQRELYLSGDEAALVFTAVQHRKGGEVVTINGVDIFQVDNNGKITSVRGYS